MRPVRSTHSSTVLTDPWTGVHICGGRSDTVHGLEGRRWLRSVSILRPTVCVCGCLAPASGLCVLCRAIGGTGLVCARCFTHCATCRNPLQRQWAMQHLVPGTFIAQLGEGTNRRPFVLRIPPFQLKADQHDSADAATGDLRLLPTVPSGR